MLGAFLILPTLLALQPVICGQFRQAAKGALLVCLFVPAILLSFSRAAWGQMVYTALLMLALTFITSRSRAATAADRAVEFIRRGRAGGGFHRGAALDRHRRRPVQAAREL